MSGNGNDNGGKRLTSGERRAFRLGVLRGLELALRHLDELRTRVAAFGVDVQPPRFWAKKNGGAK